MRRSFITAAVLSLIALSGCKVNDNAPGTGGYGYGDWVKVASGDFLTLKGDRVGSDGVCDTMQVYLPFNIWDDTLKTLSEGFNYMDSVKFYVKYLHGTDTLRLAIPLLSGDNLPPNDSFYMLNTSIAMDNINFFQADQDTFKATFIVDSTYAPFDHYGLLISLDTTNCRVNAIDSARVYYEIWRRKRL